MKDIFYFMADRAGCGHYRCILPSDALNSRPDLGWRSSYSELSGQSHTRRPDILVGQRIAKPNTSILWHALAKGLHNPMFANKPKLVLECDDDWFHVTSHQGSAAYDFYGTVKMKEALASNMRVADAVICSTETLANELREYNENIFVLENYIPDEVFNYPPQDVSGGGEDGTGISLGWGGGVSHKYDFATAEPAIIKLMEKYPKLEMHFSTVAYGSQKLLDTGRVKLRRGWLPFLKYILNHDYSIGIAPLEHSIFNSSKSHIRALELAARGIPCVASDVPAYRGFVMNGETGLLVNETWKWVRAISTLIEDPAYRVKMGTLAREWAEKWTIGRNIHNHAAIYDKIMEL